VLYKTPRGARQAAERHAEEHAKDGVQVVVVQWGTEEHAARAILRGRAMR
jgi:hypothetical protein